MFIEPFEAYTNLGAGLGCLLYGLLVRRRDGHHPVDIRLSWMLVVVGIGLAFRGVDIIEPHLIFEHGKLLGFAFLPLAVFLFAERILRRPLHLVPKLWILVGTPLFALTFPFPFALHVWWGVALLSFISLTFVYLVVVMIVQVVRLPAGPERSFLAGLLFAGVPAAPLMGTDWFSDLHMALPSLSALPVFPLLYLSMSALYRSGRFRLRHLLGRAALALVVIVGLVGLIVWVRDGSLSLVDLHAVLIFWLAFLVLDPAQRAFAERRQRSTQTLLERLRRLPRDDRDAFIAALRDWPEVVHAAVFTGAELSELGYDLVPPFVSRTADVISVRDVWLTTAVREEQAGVAEQLEHLMRTQNCEHLVRVGERGDALGATFVPYLDAQVYERVLSVAATLCSQASKT